MFNTRGRRISSASGVDHDTTKHEYHWGERSEPLLSDDGRKFLCMYVMVRWYSLIAGFYTRGPYQFRVFLTTNANKKDFE